MQDKPVQLGGPGKGRSKINQRYSEKGCPKDEQESLMLELPQTPGQLYGGAALGLLRYYPVYHVDGGAHGTNRAAIEPTQYERKSKKSEGDPK
jgi:hypothetical protein